MIFDIAGLVGIAFAQTESADAICVAQGSREKTEFFCSRSCPRRYNLNPSFPITHFVEMSELRSLKSAWATIFPVLASMNCNGLPLRPITSRLVSGTKLTCGGMNRGPGLM